MKLTTLALVATVAFPIAALAEDSTPGVTDNAPGQQRRTNGSPGDAGNTGSDSGMEASDEKAKSSPRNSGRDAASSTTGSNVGPREPGDIPVNSTPR